MGVLYIKKDVIQDWMRVTKKNFLWIAHNYNPKNPSPSYISQIVNNTTNISGNFVGFILNETNLNFDDLFYFDENVVERNFYGKKVFFNGIMLKTDEYREIVSRTIQKETLEVTY